MSNTLGSVLISSAKIAVRDYIVMAETTVHTTDVIFLEGFNERSMDRKKGYFQQQSCTA